MSEVTDLSAALRPHRHTVRGLAGLCAVVNLLMLAEPLFIPTGGPQIATVKIDPSQIDRVPLGQSASVRFPAMGAMRTPEVAGTVQLVSADALVDPVTGRRAFTVEIALAEMTDLQPQSGQPVVALLHTESRTPASFLLKPAADYWAYAMRER